MQIPSFIIRFFDKPVAVFGDGVSGRAVRGLLERLGCEYRVFDEKAGELFEKAGEFGLVVYSPSFVRGHPWREKAAEGGCLCLGEIDFASLFWPGRIVAVTGTNGKTTLTEFLAFAFNQMGLRAFPVGNNGEAFCGVFEQPNIDHNSIAVCEVSSFQAESLQFFTPSAVIWTNFAPDHIDIHGSLDTYFDAKYRLIERNHGPAIVGKSVAEYCHPARSSSAHLTVIDRDAITESPPGEFDSYPQKENFFLAKAFWQSWNLDLDHFQRCAERFTPPKHRLRKVAAIQGVTFWNDSKSTNYSSLESALKNFKKPIIWIGGGKSKNEDLNAYLSLVKPSVAEAFLIGETGPQLQALLASANIPATLSPSLQAILPQCKKFFNTTPTDVLLSPGFSSLDMFKNYAERGDVFEAEVGKLAEEK